VLVVHNAYQSRYIGGEDIVVKTEIAALKKSLGADNVFEYWVYNDEIRLVKLAREIWGSQTHAQAITQLIKQHKIDIVHVHNFFPMLTPLVFKAAQASGAKVVHTLHNYRWWCMAGTLFRANKVCETCLEKQSPLAGIVHACYRHSTLQSTMNAAAFQWYKHQHYLDHIDAFFVLTKFSQEKLSGVLPKSKLIVKPNLIDDPRITPLLSLQKQDFLFVGRLEAAKGIASLLNVFSTLPKYFCLHVIGSGEDETELKQRFQSEQIIFHGKRTHEQVMQAMHKARYLIHSSLAYETFGLTIIEAFAAGTPVIAFDVGPRRELVHHQQNGFLTTPEQLCDQLLAAWDYAEYDSLCLGAKQTAERYFAAHIIQQQIQAYQQLLEVA
jgi:glycosyltransferase involved in cell wall biosynthesis